MTLRELLPSLAVSTEGPDQLWPNVVHSHGGRMTIRLDEQDWFLDDVCDQYGDTVAIRIASVACVCVTRVRTVDTYKGLTRVVTAGAPTGVPVASTRVASRHSIARSVPGCLCTASWGCLCPAVDLPSDVRAGDVLALRTRCGTSPLFAQTVTIGT